MGVRREPLGRIIEESEKATGRSIGRFSAEYRSVLTGVSGPAALFGSARDDRRWPPGRRVATALYPSRIERMEAVARHDCRGV